MSKIGKSSIQLPEGASFTFENNILSIKGKQGNANLQISNLFKIEQKENEIFVIPKNTKDKSNPLWGTTRALVANTLKGANTFFTKTLELNGTGYRASISGSKLKLQLGFSHDIDFDIPSEVKVECPKQNIINIVSTNKELLGDVAAKIRSFKKPEPFKGKGIKYKDEFIFRKEGKKK